MFEKPTMNDFLAKVHMIQSEAIAQLKLKRETIIADMNRRGRLKSGATITLLMDAVDTAVREGTASILGELRRWVSDTDLDPAELRSYAQSALSSLFDGMQSAMNWARVSQWTRSEATNSIINERTVLLKSSQAFWIRQFDVGLDAPVGAEIQRGVTNIVNATNIVGGFQQGTHSSKQDISVSFNKEAILQAVNTVESEIEAAALPDASRNEILSELATVRAQFQKEKPNPSILKEVGKTIRSVTEGVAGNLLSPSAIAAMSYLSLALGA